MWPPVRPSVRASDNQCEMTLFSLSGSLQPTFNLMIDVHVMVNWQLSEKGICWPVAHDRATGSSFNFLRSSVACENICFSSLFATGDVSRFLHAKTSPTANSKEKRMFSQAIARSFTFLRFSADQLLAFNWSQTQAKTFFSHNIVSSLLWNSNSLKRLFHENPSNYWSRKAYYFLIV